MLPAFAGSTSDRGNIKSNDNKDQNVWMKTRTGFRYPGVIGGNILADEIIQNILKDNATLAGEFGYSFWFSRVFRLGDCWSASISLMTELSWDFFSAVV